jgi:hypothetical protein
MYWTPLNDFCQASTLRIVEVTVDIDMTGNLVDESALGVIAILAVRQ